MPPGGGGVNLSKLYCDAAFLEAMEKNYGNTTGYSAGENFALPQSGRSRALPVFPKFARRGLLLSLEARRELAKREHTLAYCVVRGSGRSFAKPLSSSAILHRDCYDLIVCPLRLAGGNDLNSSILWFETRFRPNDDAVLAQ